jgi:hypothetical protein
VDFRPIDGAGDACICFERIFGSSGTELNKDNTLTQNNRENMQDERRNDKDDERNLVFISETNVAAQEFKKQGFRKTRVYRVQKTLNL